MTLAVPLSLLFAHLVGDFFLQTDWMALNKSKKWEALTLHALVYTLTILTVVAYETAFWWRLLLIYGVVTFVTHYITDWVTSRLTSKLWFFKPVGIHYNAGGNRYECWIPSGGNRHWFFVMIGVDQFIHFVTLTYTLQMSVAFTILVWEFR